MTHPYQLNAQLRTGVRFQRLTKLSEYHLEDTKVSFSGFAKMYVILTNVDSIRITNRLDLNLDAICLLDAIGPSGYTHQVRLSVQVASSISSELQYWIPTTLTPPLVRSSPSHHRDMKNYLSPGAGSRGIIWNYIQ